MVPPETFRYFYLINHQPVYKDTEPTVELIDNIFINEKGEQISVEKINILN